MMDAAVGGFDDAAHAAGGVWVGRGEAIDEFPVGVAG